MKTRAVCLVAVAVVVGGCGGARRPAAGLSVAPAGHSAADLCGAIAKWMEVTLTSESPGKRRILYPSVWCENEGLVRPTKLRGIYYTFEDIASYRPQDALRIIDRVRREGKVPERDAEELPYIEAGLGRHIAVPDLDAPKYPWEVVGYARSRGTRALPQLKKWSAPLWPGDTAGAALVCRLLLDFKGSRQDASAFLNANLPGYSRRPVLQALIGMSSAEEALRLRRAFGRRRDGPDLYLLQTGYLGSARAVAGKLAEPGPLHLAKLTELERSAKGLPREARDNPAAIKAVEPVLKRLLSDYKALTKDRSAAYRKSLDSTRLYVEAALFLSGSLSELPRGWPGGADIGPELREAQMEVLDDIYYCLTMPRLGPIRDWDSFVPWVTWLRIHK